MSFFVKDNIITMTRGDTAKFPIEIKYLQNGRPYHPKETDILRFTVKKYVSDKKPAIVKEIPASELMLVIDPLDTKSLNFGQYHYDLELVRDNGEVETIITDTMIEISPEVS